MRAVIDDGLKKKPLNFHSRAFVLLVGRARFEIAANGLKEVVTFQNPI
jgi:hypothetical protein